MSDVETHHTHLARMGMEVATGSAAINLRDEKSLLPVVHFSIR